MTLAHVFDTALMYSRRLFASSSAPEVRVSVLAVAVSGSVPLTLRLDPLPKRPKLHRS